MKEKWPLKLKTWNFNSLSDRIITFWYYQDSGRRIADEVLYTGLLEMQELPDLSEWYRPNVVIPGRGKKGPQVNYVK